MKTWKTPEIEELNFRNTTAVGSEEDISGIMPSEIPAENIDLGTCHNPYWEGNGLTLEEAQKNNPYWGGSWGQ